MLTLRPEQMEVFKREALRSFEDEMVSKLFAFAPTHCTGIGEDAVRSVIRRGLKHAANCGFTYRGPVRYYLQLMFMLGSDFDTDPQLPPWAARALHGGSTANQMERADRLHQGVQDYLRRVGGPGNAYARKAVQNFREVAGQPLPYSAADFEDGMLRQMEHIYPERVAYVGREALSALIAEGVTVAQKQGLTTPRGTALCCMLMFELGHGCFDDPLYPWISRTVAQSPSDNPDQRAERLEGKTRAYMELITKVIGSR